MSFSHIKKKWCLLEGIDYKAVAIGAKVSWNFLWLGSEKRTQTFSSYEALWLLRCKAMLLGSIYKPFS